MDVEKIIKENKAQEEGSHYDLLIDNEQYKNYKKDGVFKTEEDYIPKPYQISKRELFSIFEKKAFYQLTYNSFWQRNLEKKARSNPNLKKIMKLRKIYLKQEDIVNKNKIKNAIFIELSWNILWHLRKNHFWYLEEYWDRLIEIAYSTLASCLQKYDEEFNFWVFYKRGISYRIRAYVREEIKKIKQWWLTWDSTWSKGIMTHYRSTHIFDNEPNEKKNTLENFEKDYQAALKKANVSDRSKEIISRYISSNITLKELWEEEWKTREAARQAKEKARKSIATILRKKWWWRKMHISWNIE